MPLLETLTDDFSTGTDPDGTKWPNTAGPTYVTVEDGRLRLTTGAASTYPWCQSAQIYTVVGSYLSARVYPPTLAGTNQSQQAFLNVDLDGNNYVGLMFGGGNLIRLVQTAGVGVQTVIAPYDPVTMAYWRVRHDGTGWRFGYSADDRNWTETGTVTTSWSPTGTMRATLMVGKWDASDPAATAYFDSVNIPPSTVTGPLVANPNAAVPLARHLLGIGPWNSSIVWRGAANHGVSAGVRASVPLVNLPLADSLTVNLRLGEAAEARSKHYFPRDEAVIIEELITDLWWRRRDPRRGVIDAIGRFNANTVDINVTEGGAGVDADVAWIDYQGWLEDRLIMKYLNPSLVPPTTMWNTGTYITDILLWAIPINMGLDLTGIQTTSRDITAKLKQPFQVPLGTPIKEMMENLLTVSDAPWEWWVEMPASDTNRPRLRLATTRGANRGVMLFDVGGHGPIESWSLQKASDKYANALYFMGNQGGVVYQYDDQILLYGERDSSFTDDTVKSGANAELLNAAAQTKLAALATPQPSYQLVLRHGFWEGRTHIDVGDTVAIRLQLGAEVIDEVQRVSELEIATDDNGLERVTVTLGARRPSKDPRSRHSSAARLVRYLRKWTDMSSSN